MRGTLVITERYTLIVSDLKFLPVLKFRLAATVVAFLRTFLIAVFLNQQFNSSWMNGSRMLKVWESFSLFSIELNFTTFHP